MKTKLYQPTTTNPQVPILLLYNFVEPPKRGKKKDLTANQDVFYTERTVATGLCEMGHHVTTIEVCNLDDVLLALTKFDYQTTLVFNLCEDLEGIAEKEALVPATLTQLGFKYTGSPSSTLATCLDKAYTKNQLLINQIPTAPYQVFHHANEPITVPLPAIIKLQAQDASIGIDSNSVVKDETSLRERVQYLLDAYQEPIMAEEFLIGREFNISVWGKVNAEEVLPLAEINFPDVTDPYQQVVHYDAKWNESSPDYHMQTVTCPAIAEASLAHRIREISLAAYKIMGCTNYARVDLRIKNGIPYVLEVNPNPSIAIDSGFVRAAGAAGFNYAQMVHHIAMLAWGKK